MKPSLFSFLTGLTCLSIVEGKIERKQLPKRILDPCNLRSDPGHCKASIPKFYFNSSLSKCQEFIYGGCGGNENNFDSERECKQRCGKKRPWKPTQKPTGKPEACNMPPVTGNCKAHMPRFYYNATANKCLQFIYGGCGGNENNFHTKHKCEQQCGSKAPWKPSPKEPAGKPAACYLPSVTGNCKASISRYHFNPKAKKCQEFIYGGCEGNANNFDSMKQCELRCGNKYDSKKDPCLASQHKGKFCAGGRKLATAVWYYEPGSKKCWISKYEKCGKNLTMFTSCSECATTCQAHMKIIQVCEKEKLPK